MSKALTKRKRPSLTHKQELFCEEYIRNRGNAAQAFKYAYDSEAKMNAVYHMAHELMHTPKIMYRISVLKTRYIARAQISPDDVVNRILDHSDKAEKLGQMNAAMKGNELLARSLHMLSDDRKMSGAHFNIQLNFGGNGQSGVSPESTNQEPITVEADITDD